MKKTVLFVLSFLMMLTLSSASIVAANENSIYDIAKSSGDFNTLTGAVEAAGLAATLDGSGPFTVFAPTDDAFAAFAASGIDPEATLRDILLYHVVSGEVDAATVVGLDSAETVLGKSIDIAVSGGNVVLNGMATVTVTDIQASNGIIHVIDAVLLPPVNTLFQSELGSEDLTIAEIAVADGRFDTLVAALDAAGLVSVFASPGDYTVFAPTDDAFAALGEDTINALLADPGGALTTILTYHVVSDSLSINQIANDTYIPTLEGRPLTVSTDAAKNVSIDGANIILFNIKASNGVIHVIDSVLIP